MNKRHFQSQLITLIFQLLLYLSVFAVFFCLLSFNNPQIIKYTRTAAITIATFAIMLVLLSNVYGGFHLGDKKPRSIFFGVLLSVIITDIITYTQLQIMNVNPANNTRLILFDEDILLLFSSIVFQVGIIALLTHLGNKVYFRINPPQQCCIIAASQEQANHVARKVASFASKFEICDVLHYNCDDLYDTIMDMDVVFLSGIPDTEEAKIETFCYKHSKSMYLAAELEDVIISSSAPIVLDDTLFLHSHRVEPTLIQRIIKRLMDIVLSAIGIIVLSPVMIATALIIKRHDKGPVFFKQKRATINGRVFTIIKFRTMFTPNQASPQYSASTNDARITKVGHVLRRLRIDELPQLFNIFWGSMSIVGPRPEMLENVDRYTRDVPEFKYRQKMKAGMTGLAQIDGKYNTTPKDKVMLDLMYIHRFSLLQDIRLMLRTVTVFFRPDSTEGFHSQDGNNTLTMRIRPKPKHGKPQETEYKVWTRPY